jgi:predicted enzyme related to lactoylglutathione lyase
MPRSSGHDVAYLVFELPDSARARAFYGSVLGLQFSPGRAHDGWNIADVVPMSGLSGGHQRPAVVPMYRVGDIHAAVARVRAAGGTATEPVVEPYGTRADCTDDQGTRFYLGQL